VKKFTFIISSLMLVILLSSWGYRGHKKISECAPPCFPASLSFLQGDFSKTLVDSASAPDNRKMWDDSEYPKHYIDIDNYAEFNQAGRIPMSWDSITRIHNMSDILDWGTLPWATQITFDSLKSCFGRNDLEKAALFAADLGHYVGDGHQPLHITANYDGDLTGNNGIHSRYETTMIGTYLSSLVYPVDSAQYIPDIQSYVFTYIYYNYQFIDSILIADNNAKALAGGNTTSSTYKAALWNGTKNFTIALCRHASFTLASMIYTAWVESQDLGINDSNGKVNLGPGYPNPVSGIARIPFTVGKDNSEVTVQVFDATGKMQSRLFSGKAGKGLHEVRWDTRSLNDGVYYCVLKSGDRCSTQKLVVIH
jgi:hypothetical protein